MSDTDPVNDMTESAKGHGSDISLTTQVDEELQRGWRGLRFSAPIEALFLKEYLKNRRRMVQLWATLGTCFYLLAIIGDLSMTPDIAPIIISLRLFIFVPFALAVIWIMNRWPTANRYDALAFGVGILGIALPMGCLIFSQSDHLFIYQTGSVSTLAFFAIVLRPRFLTVIVGLVIMIMTQFITIKLNHKFDDITYSGIVTFYLTLGTFLGLAAFGAERIDRLNFLHRLKGEFLQEELRNLSELDPLTGLYNRLMLLRLQNSLWSSKDGITLSLMMLDIDHFKKFNDIHGHIEGDDCIRQVSKIVSQQVGSSGITCRYGGEELLILLPNISAETAHQLAEKIRRAIEERAIVHCGLAGDGIVTASLGVTTGHTSRESLRDLLLQADSALYEAKRNGKNRIHSWAGASIPMLHKISQD